MVIVEKSKKSDTDWINNIKLIMGDTDNNIGLFQFNSDSPPTFDYSNVESRKRNRNEFEHDNSEDDGCSTSAEHLDKRVKPLNQDEMDLPSDYYGESGVQVDYYEENNPPSENNEPSSHFQHHEHQVVVHHHHDHHVPADIPESNASESLSMNMSSKGLGMLQKMGWTGDGLGKFGQGRREPVQAFIQKGRRGLGHNNVKLRQAELKWDPSAEIVSVREDVSWVSTKEIPPTAHELNNWLGIDSAEVMIENATHFCDADILRQIIESKSVFDSLDKKEMRTARTRSNPFENIRGAFFQNRAAVKMANIDRAYNHIFTKPIILNMEPLYFADVCAGPGGFSEYVLWRRKWHAKGFGFTLKHTNDFKLDEFYAGSPETFHPYYGVKDDGDIYDPENQESFQKLIMQQTGGRGVHFMMSDGGFSVEGQENNQEILSKQLYLCQCLVALQIVRSGGHFVTKLFDLFTPFSAGLVYLMYRCFENISIFKPNTSRPANSERYLICQNKIANVDAVIKYLQFVNNILLQKDKSHIVVQLVPLNILKNDENFYNYLKQSNNLLGKKQIVGLLKVAAYCENTTLVETRQAAMRKDCLTYWAIPDQTRTTPRNSTPEERLSALIPFSLRRLYNSKAQLLTLENMDKTILNRPCDWYCVPCANTTSNGDICPPTFYFGMGRTKVYRFEKDKWISISNVELPPDTLVFGELVYEYRGQYKTQTKTTSLHIIDAWLLGGEDISRKLLPERMALINKFCNALWKPTNSEHYRVRPKRLHSLDDDLHRKLYTREVVLKNGKTIMGYYPDELHYSFDTNSKEQYFIIPTCVMFLRSTALPWSLFLSKSTGHHYFSNYQTRETAYNNRRPDSAVSSFLRTSENRLIWNWHTDTSINLFYLVDKTREICPGRSRAHTNLS